MAWFMASPPFLMAFFRYFWASSPGLATLAIACSLPDYRRVMLHEGKTGLDVVRGHAFGGIEFGKHNLPHAPGLQMAVCDREYLRVGLAVRAP